eukprot:4245012-Alexandrium_andersonii.AAC.1
MERPVHRSVVSGRTGSLRCAAVRVVPCSVKSKGAETCLPCPFRAGLCGPLRGCCSLRRLLLRPQARRGTGG